MSNTIGNTQIDSVLSQIRALSSQIKATQVKPTAETGVAGSVATGAVAGSSFAALMQQGLSSVNQMQQSADSLATDFQRGKPGVELADVMIEMQKASVSFRAATEVRNRMVTAYQDIMNMQI
jgi:flagellar hook-basal body complex protein FliE